ncbi:DUF3891 family protein [Paenibacillus sp. NPDC058071]|uniref:DUF3891 family protein n=1 Tax=Paenibacillus sp. NPDC058071 TaxID=3346326 RepID=UPI0036D8F753
MIVYEKEHAFVLIAQHDHARISGDLMKAWESEAGQRDPRTDDMILAAYEHDRSWIDLDCWPLWNDAARKPYSFIDFPGNIRFHYYTKGLDEVQRSNGYAALLGSMLYTSLAEKFENDDAVRFVNREYARQRTIKRLFKVDESRLQNHISALVLCDGLSLFACMNEPGTPREQFEWFADGFAYIREGEPRRLNADWNGVESIELRPFPFASEVRTVIIYKEVDKAEVARLGIGEAYKREILKEKAIVFRGGEPGK